MRPVVLEGEASPAGSWNSPVTLSTVAPAPQSSSWASLGPSVTHVLYTSSSHRPRPHRTPTLTSFPGDPSRPGGPMAPGSP